MSYQNCLKPKKTNQNDFKKKTTKPALPCDLMSHYNTTSRRVVGGLGVGTAEIMELRHRGPLRCLGTHEMKLPVFFNGQKKNIKPLRPKQSLKQPGDTFRFQHFLGVHELFREFLQTDMSETSKMSENDDSDLQRKPSTPQPDKTSAPISPMDVPRANTIGCKHTN